MLAHLQEADQLPFLVTFYVANGCAQALKKTNSVIASAPAKQPSQRSPSADARGLLRAGALAMTHL